MFASQVTRHFIPALAAAVVTRTAMLNADNSASGVVAIDHEGALRQLRHWFIALRVAANAGTLLLAWFLDAGRWLQHVMVQHRPACRVDALTLVKWKLEQCGI
jgi:hypothetical protein